MNTATVYSPESASYAPPMGKRTHAIVHRAGCPKTTGIGSRPVAEVADGLLVMARPARCCDVKAVRAIIGDAERRENARALAAAQPVDEPAAPAPTPAPRHRISPVCEHYGCTTHARNVVRVTADGGVVIVVKLCQRHTLALGSRGEVIGAVR